MDQKTFFLLSASTSLEHCWSASGCLTVFSNFLPESTQTVCKIIKDPG